MTLVMCSIIAILLGAALWLHPPLTITLLIYVVYQLAPSFSCHIFGTWRQNHRFSRVPRYKIYLLQFPCWVCLGYVSGTYLLLVSHVPTISLQSEVPPRVAAGLQWSGVGAECFCTSLLNLPSTQSWINRNYKTIFKWKFHFFILIASQGQVTTKRVKSSKICINLLLWDYLLWAPCSWSCLNSVSIRIILSGFW